MIRTQIQFNEEQHRALKRLAFEEGVSVAEIVRRCVDARLEAEEGRAELWQRARRFFAVIDDPTGPVDLSVRHDELLDEGW